MLEYRAPELSPDEVDGKLFTNKKADSNFNFGSLLVKHKTAATTHRAASFAGKNRESVTFATVKSKTPVIGRKSAPAKERTAASGEVRV